MDPTPALHLFGPPLLRSAGGEMAFVAERRFQLLALLALHGDWVSRDRVAGLLWPELPNESARRNLRKLIFKVRAGPTFEALEVEALRLRWAVRTDVETFAQALASGRRDDAIALYRGPLLEGLDDDANPAWTDWLGAERQRWAQRWRSAAEDALQAAGDPSARRRLAERMLSIDPLDETALAALLRLERARGGTASAERLYRDFAARLAADLGIEPATALRELAFGAAAPPETAVAAAAAPTPGFVGRRTELAELSALLGRRECRLLTLLGPGGIGKSRLAREALPRLAPAFAGGCHWIDLQDLDAMPAVVARTAQVLGLELDERGDALGRLLLALPTARHLLVFDNAEHLPDLPPMFERLIAASPGTCVLATSRSRFWIEHEWPLALGGLAVPDSDSRDLQAAPQFDAVGLFTQRAQAVQRGFALAPHLEAVIAITEAVEGLPLALELAASWVRLLPPEEIARDLRRSIDLLERDPALPGAPARPEHASMRAVLDRSWGLLAPAQRKTLAALSVFEGGFTHAAARDVAGAALPLLSSLVDRSLLGVAEDGRFVLHPLVAAHAAQRLAADAEAAAAARLRHAGFFARHLEALAPQAIGDQRLLVAGVTAEFSNCRAAWRHALEARRADLAASMVRALWSFFENRGRLAEGIELLQPGLALFAGAPGGELARARLRHGLSMLWHRRGEHDTGRAIADAGIPDGEDCGDTEAWVGCVLNAGSCALGRGRLDEALALFERALAIAQSRADRHGVGWALGNIGVVQNTMDRLEPAQLALEEALAIMREQGDSYNTAVNLFNLAMVLQDQGDLPAARQRLEEAVRHCAAFEIGLIGQYSALGLAAVLGKLGQNDEARRRLRATVEWSQRAGAMPMACNAHLALARVELREGRLADALAPLQAAGRIAGAMAALPDQTTVLLSFGQWLADSGDRRRAAAVWGLLEQQATVDSWTRNAARERRLALALDAAEAAAADAAPHTVAAALALLAAVRPGEATAGQRPAA